MKLLFLGTGAAEAIPALWCECELCRNAARVGGPEIRRRASYLIDDDTLVDFGPDVFWQSVQFGVDLCAVKRLIITHPHEDHLNPVELLWREDGYSAISHQVKLFGGRMVMECVLKETGMEFSRLKLIFRQLAAGVAAVDEDMEILPLDANHAPGLTPFIYVISRGGRRLLIGNDTGYFTDQAWRALAGIRLDAAVLECTGNFRYPDSRDHHMGINVTVEVRDRLLELGCIDAATPVYVTHFSHNGGGSHRRLEEFFSPRGIIVASDGLRCEI